MDSIQILGTIIIEKIFKEWKINLIIKFDTIIFKIENDFKIYESSFSLKKLKELFSKNYLMNEMIDYLLNCIENNKISIEEKEKYLQLSILSKYNLKIKEKNKLSEEIIEKLIKEIKKLKEENQKLELRIQNIEKEKINIQLTHCNLKEINSIKAHNDSIESLAQFPSGNIISVSKDNIINIYDNNLNIIQNFSNIYDDSFDDDKIRYVSIKDENNFVTGSKKYIRIWIKKKSKENLKNENIFKLNQKINAHDDLINKIIYCLNGNIISCSEDKKIKIWEEDNDNIYKCIKILTLNYSIISILLLEDKNILISSGGNQIILWNLKLNNSQNIIHSKEKIEFGINGLKRIDEDRIIVATDKIINIISINKNKIIKEIENEFICKGICVIKEKGIFLCGGFSKNIKIYRNDNYECIKTIKDALGGVVNGIYELNDGSIASYGYQIIKIWSL